MGYLDLEIDQLCINLESTKDADCDSKSIRSGKQIKVASRLYEDQSRKEKSLFLSRSVTFNLKETFSVCLRLRRAEVKTKKLVKLIDDVAHRRNNPV